MRRLNALLFGDRVVISTAPRVPEPGRGDRGRAL